MHHSEEREKEGGKKLGWGVGEEEVAVKEGGQAVLMTKILMSCR